MSNRAERIARAQALVDELAGKQPDASDDEGFSSFLDGPLPKGLTGVSVEHPDDEDQWVRALADDEGPLVFHTYDGEWSVY